MRPTAGSGHDLALHCKLLGAVALTSLLLSSPLAAVSSASTRTARICAQRNCILLARVQGKQRLLCLLAEVSLDLRVRSRELELETSTQVAKRSD